MGSQVQILRSAATKNQWSIHAVFAYGAVVAAAPLILRFAQDSGEMNG